MKQNPINTLYTYDQDKANCGFGLSANIKNEFSHKLLENSLTALSKMEHRGGLSDDKKTGDGCGVLIKKSYDFFTNEYKKITNKDLPKINSISMVFLPKEEATQQKIKSQFQAMSLKVGLDILCWRKVPTNPDVLGEIGRESMPNIEQCFIGENSKNSEFTFEVKLFKLKRALRNTLSKNKENKDFYIASMSEQMISYKGMLIPELLRDFYLDLSNEKLTTSICMFHQRFATNTLPLWSLAQPFSVLAHNGEINSISGNITWAKARKSQLLNLSPLNEYDLEEVVVKKASDSSTLNDMLQVLIAGGIELVEAIRILIPPAWQNDKNLTDEVRAYYKFNSLRMEPWDGPAGIVTTNGKQVVCTLDRNGLRPSRWVITDKNTFVIASEAGLEPKDEIVLKKGKIGPGEIISIDVEKQEILFNRKQVDDVLAKKYNYVNWLKTNCVNIETNTPQQNTISEFDKEQLLCYRKMFQLTREEMELSILPMAKNGIEATSSMGDDTPVAVLSKKIRMLPDYFRQQFAQITNPPIDPIREGRGMSLNCVFSVNECFFDSEKNKKYISLETPVISTSLYKSICSFDGKNGFATKIFDLTYSGDNLKQSLIDLQNSVVEYVKSGKNIIVLDDRCQNDKKLPISALLATGAIHSALIKNNLRLHTNIVISSATARDSHQIATLIGYGANAVHPYLAYEAIKHEIPKQNKNIDAVNEAINNYNNGLNKALLKILSKMGISCIDSYRGAQLFEALGVGKEVVDLCFKGTSSPIGGIDFEHIHTEAKEIAKFAYSNKPINNGGLVKYTFDGEYHCFNPDVVTGLIESVKVGNYDVYKKIFANVVNTREPATIRDLLVLQKRKSIPVEEVEPIEKILPRFDSAGMSLGALSPEVHEILAMAMNQIGGRSNSGEGGEAKIRLKSNKRSKIKQIASGRFGVTPEYLVSAEVLQIKIAQGAKPGEGGQLPKEKVNPMIAELRCSVPWTMLISPPPHHDIYSIEDVAQLIYDLKQVNPTALVSIKLVAQPGIGTIAAGLTKSYADLITIAGYDGGTGASPLTSIRYAGSAWEIGLSEVQQSLRINNLRHRVQLQADGGLKTGLDIVKAAILGAESFGFGTPALVAMGCKFIRVCHLNNCPAGVNTQNEELRAKYFQGNVEKVVNYFTFVATEIREILSQLGAKTLDEIIGKTDLIAENKELFKGKFKNIDLSKLTNNSYVADSVVRKWNGNKNHPHDKGEFAKKIFDEVKSSIDNSTGGVFPANNESYKIHNNDRSFGALLSGYIASLYDNEGMANNPITLNLEGSAGQSLGVWNVSGLNINIVGEANDYVCKGMNGGEIVIQAPKNSKYNPHDSSIIGNACLYGATGGSLFAQGTAGERLAVRNSGARVFVEGAGDHCCEYMTGGSVVVLGKVGANFGAGMSGGFAFVLDDIEHLKTTYNNEMVELSVLDKNNTEACSWLKQEIEEYCRKIDSDFAKEILQNFDKNIQNFVQITPIGKDIKDLIKNNTR